MVPSMDDLRAAGILAGLAGTRFRHVECHAVIGSTQTLLMEEGGGDGRVVVADRQTAGRGRVGRRWESPGGVSIHVSVLLAGLPADLAPLTSLAAGVAVARAVEDVSGAEPSLKWPNDVLLDDRKLCGILGELAPGGGYLVLGIGVNVRQSADELPAGVEATSLKLATGRDPDRGELLVRILRELDGLVGETGWLDEYRDRCGTLGREVRVELSDGVVEGEASEVRDDGALVVGGHPIVSGDVVHVRRVP